MCGLVGIVDFNNSNKNFNSEITNMIKKIQHRGPDNNKIGSYKNYHYGFNRLSIIDLSSNANQPFEDSQIISMANCEIYNYKKIKSQYRKDEFISSSDSEVIPFLYKKLGTKFLDEIDGMFAFALFDKLKDKIYLGRDRLGIKPLYYYYDNKYLAFASEIKALLELKFIEKNINLDTLNKYLISGFGSLQNTFIKNINTVPPASFIEISSNEINITKYYNKPEQFIDFENNKDVLNKFQNTINESVESHLISDVPTSLMLSYGKDSNILNEIISKKNLFNFKTFTLGSDDFNKSEIFKDNDKNHKNFKIDFKTFNNLEEKFIDCLDQPTVDGLNTYIISKFISEEGYRVVLSGLGADELLGGYGAFSFLPNIYKSRLNFYLISKLPFLFNFFINYQKSEKIKKLFRSQNFENVYSVFRDYSLNNESLNIEKIFDNKKLFSNNNNEFYLNGWRYTQELEIINYLQRRLLPDSDVFSMANSVELRVPFLSNKLIDLSLSVNFNKFKKLGYQKQILNKLYYNSLNKKIFSRRKQGFALPMNNWLKNKNFEDKILYSFNNHSLLELDKDFKIILSDIINLFKEGRIDYEIVWKYYVLDKWIKKNNINFS